eukprot:jgi/Mesen1/7904/ME000420S07044
MAPTRKKPKTSPRQADEISLKQFCSVFLLTAVFAGVVALIVAVGQDAMINGVSKGMESWSILMDGYRDGLKKKLTELLQPA